VELRVPRVGRAGAGHLPHHLRRGDARHRRPRRGRRHHRVREPVCASGCFDRARRWRHRQALSVHLPRVDVRSARQPHRHRVREGLQWARRHAGLVLQGGSRTAQAADGDAARSRLRHAVGRDAADGGVRRRGDPRPDCARAAPAGARARPLRPGAAEQLEALRREREGHVPREPPARVLRHLPDHAAHAGRRRPRERRRRPPRVDHDQPARGPHVDRLSRSGHPVRARGLSPARPEPARRRGRVRRRHPAADSHRVPELRVAADPELPGCAAGPAQGARRDGAALDVLRLRRRRSRDAAAPTSTVQPRRAGRIRLHGGRLRRRLRAARRRRRPRGSSRS